MLTVEALKRSEFAQEQVPDRPASPRFDVFPTAGDKRSLILVGGRESR